MKFGLFTIRNGFMNFKQFHDFNHNTSHKTSKGDKPRAHTVIYCSIIFLYSLIISHTKSMMDTQ